MATTKFLLCDGSRISMDDRQRLRSTFANYALAILFVTSCTSALRAADPPRQHFSPEMVDFVPYEKNPVFTAAGPGHWDVKIRERGWILRDGDQYLMWYTGYNGARTGIKMLGLATSRDGLAWTRYPKNPIYD